MEPGTALVALAAALLVATAVGVLVRRRDGRVGAVRGDDPVAPSTLGLDAATAGFGERATLVQFSTEYCARCPATRRVLREVATARPGVAHVDVDLTHRPDVARRFGVLQTPTTLVLDGDRIARARIGGAPRSEDVVRELDRILEDSRV
ncbi:TlpA family protein disulfide reductase [Microbacterium album]|uniref:Thioredoxin domain-containing protein n=1 Tax=Microbacterium album TaxID=2053191 RepID=A0A917MM35_9MICO|nr:thioredoxin family protein [Microbacterium album]GGH46405.1 hypothetical protein GCM10010921_22440 [Microbacterium album]